VILSTARGPRAAAGPCGQHGHSVLGYNDAVIDAFEGLDRIPWPDLHHAYGPATDVPDQLRALRSSDPAARDWAAFALMGNVYHQGARWPASAHVVPFLVALVDDPGTPDRAGVARLLRAVALGDRTDRHLPFSAAVAFAGADAVTAAQEARSLAALESGDEGWDSVEAIDDAEACALKWERDAYLAAGRHTARYGRWIADRDTEVAARAAELLAWFPITPATIVALIAMPPDPARWQPRASANLTLAHLPSDVPGMTESLRAQLHATPPPVRLTAAIALAYRMGERLPPAALDVLVADGAHEGPAAEGIAPPWERTLAGFARLARRRAGLG
jgi:hypothetical protein